MQKQKIIVALAALSLSACNEPPRPRAAPVVAVKPAPAPVARVVELRDAGAPVAPVTQPPPVDSLALSHESPGVDHLGRARTLQSEGDVKGALIEARRALFTTPSDVETLTVVARLAKNAREPQLAAEAWGRISVLVADDATPLVAQSRALLSSGDAVAAINAGRAAIVRDAGNAEAFQAVGLAQLAQKDLSGAIISFEKAVELNPSHGYALNNLGLACLRANQNERAVEVLERAAEQLPTVAYVQNNLGIALERVGRTDEATAAYQQAMDLSPKYVKARVNAARVAKVIIEVDRVENDEE